MDFPGGAVTNVHLVDGFSTIYWRIYTEEPGISSQPSEGPANGFIILKHLGRLKNLEARLRNLNCLASCPRRLGLWVFSPTPNFESLGTLYVKEGGEQSKKICVDSTTLKVSASGSITSQELIKSLSSETQNSQGPQTAGPQRQQQNPSSSRRPDGYSSSAAIYASFISAITGALNLHLARSHGALPLGSRTLFTAVERLGYETPRIGNESSLSISCLTTLNVQLNAPGTLTISLQTISQAGLRRVCSPQDDISDVLRVQPGTDIWLCPNGTIARLVTANIEAPAAPSPEFPSSGDASQRRRQWKLDVVHWLGNFGLRVDSVDEEPWVEVEVWEPFFARLAGEAWRQQDETQSALPLKRMLWPARFCFRRSNPTHSSLPQTGLDDPLAFNEIWSSEVASLKSQVQPQSAPVYEEAQTKDQEMSSPTVENGEGLESLSRMAQYPDLQTINLVYPTPPDGAAATGLTTAHPDAFPEDNDFNLTPGAAQDAKPQFEAKASPNVGVGTGRYDASDDEDLFGEMNDRDFGSKGITDADFSFFDDPGFDQMDDDTPIDQPHETPQAPSETIPAPEDKPDGKGVPIDALLDVSDNTNPIEGEKETGPGQTDQKAPDLVEGDEPMGIDSSPQPSPGSKEQPISPPLSPVEIKKILFSDPKANDKPTMTGGSQQGHYHPVAFEKKLGDWDQKYGSAGKFSFAPGKVPKASEDSLSSIPTVGLPHRGRAKVANGKIAQPLTLETQGLSTSGSGDDSSDDSDDTASEHVPTPVILPSLKRKRVPSESDIQSTASPTKSLGPPDTGPGCKIENITFLGNFLANFSDWTFIGYFSAFQTAQLPVLVRRDEQIAVAQLLVDQVTQSSLDHSLGGRIGLFNLESEGLSLRSLLEKTTFLGDVTRLDLKGYMSLQDEKDEMTAISTQPPKDLVKSSLSRMPVPHIRIRRGQEYLEALPPAISFWETFGLEPAYGPKNISAYCIHPHAAANAADVFLNRFALQYQSCNLGSHKRGNKSLAFENGLRSWSSEPSSYATMMHSLQELCEDLGTDLSQATADTENCVVYIINPFPHASALADICAAFWHLFQQMIVDADRQEARQMNEVVLQIIPMDFIKSGDSIAVPSQPEYLNLALEVYSRCRPGDASPSPLICAPPILLADPLLKAFNFRLAPEKASPLQDGRSLHIACSKSVDQRWVSVAWSDGTGCLQTSTSYCLRYRNGGAPRTIPEVRNEIWAVTKHIIDKFQGRWKVILVNLEPIDSDEVETWTGLAEQQNKMRPGSMELTMITVNATPDLVLESVSSPMTSSVLNAQFSSTPASTPNPSANIASPEQSGNAPTPSAAYNAPTPTEPSMEPDSEAVLMDISDESWAVVLSHRLNSSPHVTEFRPALASGYLLRRKGSTDGDGVFSVTVNLIFSQRPPSTHETTLKEILGMYRDLASLARARGMRSAQSNTLPWHIATALRAQELLSYVI